MTYLPLKIGYYISYKDPKDACLHNGVLLNFDEEHAIVWKTYRDLTNLNVNFQPYPYVLHRSSIVKGYEGDLVCI